MDLETFIRLSLDEDIGVGDHSTLATIPEDATGRAVMLGKETGVLAGLALACAVFRYHDPHVVIRLHKEDGGTVAAGEEVMAVEGRIRTLLQCERLVLNCVQRMSGIATLTARYVKAVRGTGVRILDTRKTTPLFRRFEKEAVRLGGGHNHRMGLYDMVMLKDNHIDFAGGIRACLEKTAAYLADRHPGMKVEIEVRSLDELDEALSTGHLDRILLDNFEPALLAEAVQRVAGRYETEASGGITLDNVRAFAGTGVTYISVGALTHSYHSLDLSLKAGS